MTFSTVYITASDKDEAMAIGKALVTDRLAACANVFDGVRSLYRWEGKVQDDQEAVLILKTRAELVDAVTNRVKELHSYNVPCIVSWPIQDGNSEYLSWLHAETEAAPK
jgi:periplasmic divalent cation tolerance protein